MPKKNSIAIIGAGLSGLILANFLAKKHEVKIFEKARGVGGRMASRTKENLNFDFGCQFFLAKTLEFNNFLQPFIDNKILLPWNAKFAEIDNYQITLEREWNEDSHHFVASNKINQFPKELAKNLDITLQTKITKIQKINRKWHLFDDKDLLIEKFDWVFITCPNQQTVDLITNAKKNCDFFENLHQHKMLGCFALMLAFDQSLNLKFDVSLVKNSIISWISHEDSKPNKTKNNAYTILSQNNWAEKNIEQNPDIVSQELIAEFSKIINQKLPNILHQDLHKWRYANIKKQNNLNHSYIDKKNKIGVCGDWLIQGRVEASFLSATNLIQKFNEFYS